MNDSRWSGLRESGREQVALHRRGVVWTVTVIVMVAVLVVTSAVHCSLRQPEPSSGIKYDETVSKDNPVAFWALEDASSGREDDLIGGLEGRYENRPTSTRMPNGDSATAFNGVNQYFEVPDSPRLSPSSSGVFTIEAWMRPDTLQFDVSKGDNYVNWLGKGEVGSHEYAARIYNRVNDADRPNRISGYIFNDEGGRGAGSAFEDHLRPGEWIHFAFVVNGEVSSDEYPNGYTKIYRDGVLRSQNDISIDGEPIQSARTAAPLRVGTRDGGSYFEGGIGKVAIYGYEVDQQDLCEHFQKMQGTQGTSCE